MTVNNDIDGDSATKHGDSDKERGKCSVPLRWEVLMGIVTSSRSASSPL